MKLKKWWTLFWFNDYTREIGVFFGGHLIVTAPLFIWIFGTENIRLIIGTLYCAVLLLAVMDNDYSKLRKYGRDEYGNRLKERTDEQ